MTPVTIAGATLELHAPADLLVDLGSSFAGYRVASAIRAPYRPWRVAVAVGNPTSGDLARASDVIRHVYREDPSGAITTYAIDLKARQLSVALPIDPRAARLSLLRTVRTLLAAELGAAGFVALHAAAFVVSDRAVLLTGPKRSGKTTVLLSTLLNSRAALMANDTVYLRRTGATIEAVGLPVAIGIRKSTIRAIPELARVRAAATAAHPDNASGPGEKIVIPPHELARLLGVSTSGSATLGAIVVTRFDAQTRGAKLTPVSGHVIRDLLGTERLPVGDKYRRFLVPDDAESGSRRWSEAIERIAEATPVFRLNHGPGSLDYIARLLRDVTASLGAPS
jgi:hypothetical protein